MKDTHKLKLEWNKEYSGLVLDGTGYAETLKASAGENITVRDFSIIGGYEDCIDCVQGTNYTFADGSLLAGPKTRTFITLKGGINGVILKNLVLSGKCRWPWDISLGDHTIYNKGKLMNQQNILIEDVRRTDPKRRVRVLVLDSEAPVVINSSVMIIKVPRWIVWLLMKLKR